MKIDKYKASFINGVFEQKSTQTINYKYYTKNTYYVPQSIIGTLFELDSYFEQLDNNESLKDKYKIRTQRTEYMDLASNIFKTIRCHLLRSSDELMALGSNFLCPIPWAILGRKETPRLAQHYFRNFDQFITHYNRFEDETEITKVTINQRPTQNYFLEVSIKSKLSINLIVSMSVLLLKDIIENCGPDCMEFREAYTNDSRDTFESAIPYWQKIRNIVDQVPVNLQSYFRRKYYYNEIEIIEALNFPLCSTEKVYAFSDIKYKEKMK
jgi:hypothetical protein